MRKGERWTELYVQIDGLLRGEKKRSGSDGFEDIEYGHLEPCEAAACGGRLWLLEKYFMS